MKEGICITCSIYSIRIACLFIAFIPRFSYNDTVWRMIMVKGLVLFDYDGTLVDEREEIFVPTAKTKAAISTLQDQGFLCVLATGRALSYIPNGAKDLYLDGYITSNGAYVTIHGNVIHNDVFDDCELQELITYMDKHNINYILEGTTYCYVRNLKDKSYLHFMDNFKVPKDNFIRYHRYGEVKGKIGKITLAFPNREALETAHRHLKLKYKCSFHRNCDTFDIGKLSINKGVGVKEIINNYHVPLDKTYAFGDGDNDVELLSTVTYGVAMYKHNPLLDRVAYMVTESVKNEGIYEALKKMEVI